MFARYWLEHVGETSLLDANCLDPSTKGQMLRSRKKQKVAALTVPSLKLSARSPDHVFASSSRPFHFSQSIFDSSSLANAAPRRSFSLETREIELGFEAGL